MTTNNQNSLDAIFDEFMNGNPPFANDYSKVQAQAFVDYLRPKLSVAINKTIMEDFLAMIGDDLPMDQPFDNDMDPVELVGNRLFRKGANWAKAELRQQITKKYGRADNEAATQHP